MEKEIILNFCSKSGTLRAFEIVGQVINVIRILVPVLLVVVSIKSFYKTLLDEKMDIKEPVKLFITKFVIGAFIFFIPSIFTTIFSLIEDYNKTTESFASCSICMFDASACDEKINIALEKERIIAESKREELRTRKEKVALEKAAKEKERQLEKENEYSSDPGDSNGAYGRGCKSYVSEDSYDENIANKVISKGKTKLGTGYVWGSWDCSAFVSYVYSDYVNTSTAAGLASQTSDRCVRMNEVKPGDLFFTSRYNSSYSCTNCADTGRCDRWQCIMHIGIVYEVQNGRVTKILHNGSGVAIVTPSYGYFPNSSGSAWYIQFSRPYA